MEGWREAQTKPRQYKTTIASSTTLPLYSTLCPSFNPSLCYQKCRVLSDLRYKYRPPQLPSCPPERPPNKPPIAPTTSQFIHPNSLSQILGALLPTPNRQGSAGPGAGSALFVELHDMREQAIQLSLPVLSPFRFVSLL